MSKYPQSLLERTSEIYLSKLFLKKNTGEGRKVENTGNNQQTTVGNMNKLQYYHLFLKSLYLLTITATATDQGITDLLLVLLAATDQEPAGCSRGVLHIFLQLLLPQPGPHHLPLRHLA